MDFPYGTISTDPPSGFAPPEMWPEYGHIADPAPICAREIINENPVAIRWAAWPLCFEEHIGDAEPDIQKAAVGKLIYNRIAFWRRLKERDVPPGWIKGMGKTFRVDGYQLLEHTEDFTSRWNKNARREVRIWQEKYLNKTHSIENISFDEYAVAYKKSLIAERTGLHRLDFMANKLKIPITSSHCQILGVREIRSGKLVAGTGIIFSPLYSSSTHLVPFIHNEARQIFAATGLIHHWFEQSRAQGMPNIVTTNFWHPGKPKSWKGFSEFKSHFGFTYVAYPPLLWRFVRGKLF